MSTRNENELKSFTRFCQAHPDLRFYQALRAWSGYGAIFAAENADGEGMKSTFYWEGRRAPGEDPGDDGANGIQEE